MGNVAKHENKYLDNIYGLDYFSEDEGKKKYMSFCILCLCEHILVCYIDFKGSATQTLTYLTNTNDQDLEVCAKGNCHSDNDGNNNKHNWSE